MAINFEKLNDCGSCFLYYFIETHRKQSISLLRRRIEKKLPDAPKSFHFTYVKKFIQIGLKESISSRPKYNRRMDMSKHLVWQRLFNGLQRASNSLIHIAVSRVIQERGLDRSRSLCIGGKAATRFCVCFSW